MKVKILAIFILVFISAVVGGAQEPKPEPKIIDEKMSVPVKSFPDQEIKATAEVIGSTEKIVKGAPFSAEALSESIQILGDGNRIVRRTITKMYRDGEGRFRREEITQPYGKIGAIVEIPPTILIIDPVAGFRYFLNTKSKTVRQDQIKGLKVDIKIQKDKEILIDKERQKPIKKQPPKESFEKGNPEKIKTETPAEIEKGIREKIIKKTRDEAKKEMTEAKKIMTEAKKEITEAKKAEAIKKADQKAKISNSKDTKIEPLGVQKIEGVEAEGIRSTRTIEAGVIGNERPINIIYERWYSKELQIMVMSKHSDPRFGEQNYRLTNIKRQEPDPSLFNIPADYKPLNDKKPPQIPKRRTDSTPPESPKPPTVEKKPSP